MLSNPVFFPNPTIEIYNRYGQRIYSASNYQDDWSASGESAGTYFWIGRSTNGKEIKGWIEVQK
jgi:hypothetical protein